MRVRNGFWFVFCLLFFVSRLRRIAVGWMMKIGTPAELSTLASAVFFTGNAEKWRRVLKSLAARRGTRLLGDLFQLSFHSFAVLLQKLKLRLKWCSIQVISSLFLHTVFAHKFLFDTNKIDSYTANTFSNYWTFQKWVSWSLKWQLSKRGRLYI